MPWYNDMAALIGQRPNQVPAGVGNAAADVDNSVFGLPNHTELAGLDADNADLKPESAADAECENKPPQPPAAPMANPLDYVFSDDDDDEDSPIGKGKGKARSPKLKGKAVAKSVATPTKPEPGSTVSKAASAKKPSTVEQRFADLAKEEETTKQSMLAVRRKRIESDADVARERLQLERIRLEHRAERQRQKHEARMAELALRRFQYEQYVSSSSCCLL
jgi:hypothetical protein